MSDDGESSIVAGVVPLPRGTDHAGIGGIWTARDHVDRALRESLEAAGRPVDVIDHSLVFPPGPGDSWDATVRPGGLRVCCEVQRAWPWARLQVVYEVVER